jgi:DinB superfamily
VQRCNECGYVFDVDAGELPGRLTVVAAAIGERVATVTPVAAVRRPAASSWSALELACHVRDVFLAQRERIVRTLVEDRPSFPPMHRDERVALERYADQPPSAVATDLAVAARLLAGVLTGRSAAELERRCVYNYPEPSERSLLWIGRNALHEGEHHLVDVDRALASG